jgi:hypothetical protein
MFANQEFSEAWEADVINEDDDILLIDNNEN